MTNQHDPEPARADHLLTAALDALDNLLMAYADLDELHDRWVDADPEGASPEDRRIQKQSNKTRDRVLKMGMRLRKQLKGPQ